MAKKFLTPIDLAKNEIQNAAFQNLGSAPGTPATGQFYLDTNGAINQPTFYNGSAWVQLALRTTNTFTGKQNIPASLASQAYLNLATGVAVTSGWATGDIWSTGTRLHFYDGSADKTIAFLTDVGGSQDLHGVAGVGATTTISLTVGPVLTINHSANVATIVGAASATTATLFNTISTTINAFQAGTAINMGATTGTLTLNNPTIVGSQASLTLFNTVATTVDAFGAAATLGIGATTGTMTLKNPTIVGSQAAQTLFNTVATTMNFAGAAATIAIGATTGTMTLNNPTVVGSQATQVLYNTVATNMSFAGAASTLTMGATTGTCTLNNPTVVGSQTTQNLWNTVATTVNAFGVATTQNFGTSATTAVTATFGGTTSAITNILKINSNVDAGATLDCAALASTKLAKLFPSVAAGTITLGEGLTTGIYNAAGGLTTGQVNIANGATALGTSQTTTALNLMSGAMTVTTSGTRTVNIGNNGTANLTTNINIGTTSTASSITNINLGAASTTTVTVLGTFKVGVTTLAAGVNGTITLPASAGTLALTSDIKAGTLGAASSTAGATNTGVEVAFSAAWDANSASNVTIKNVVGPAITALAAAMTGAGSGFLKKTAADTYAVDTGTYALQSYVDNAVAGLAWKDEVAVASTANLAVASAVVNGASVDGYTLVTGDRILLKNQSTASENGIYIVASSGAASRATDADSAAKIAGCSVYVVNGTAGGGKRFTLSVVGAITLGSTSLPFVLFGADTGGNLVNKYAIDLTASSTSYVITHNLNTLDVTVAVYTISGGVEVECDVTHTSTTQVTLGFSVAPAGSTYRVVVHG